MFVLKICVDLRIVIWYSVVSLNFEHVIRCWIFMFVTYFKQLRIHIFDIIWQKHWFVGYDMWFWCVCFYVLGENNNNNNKMMIIDKLLTK